MCPRFTEKPSLSDIDARQALILRGSKIRWRCDGTLYHSTLKTPAGVSLPVVEKNALGGIFADLDDTVASVGLPIPTYHILGPLRQLRLLKTLKASGVDTLDFLSKLKGNRLVFEDLKQGVETNVSSLKKLTLAHRFEQTVKSAYQKEFFDALKILDALRKVDEVFDLTASVARNLAKIHKAGYAVHQSALPFLYDVPHDTRLQPFYVVKEGENWRLVVGDVGGLRKVGVKPWMRNAQELDVVINARSALTRVIGERGVETPEKLFCEEYFRENPNARLFERVVKNECVGAKSRELTHIRDIIQKATK